MNPRPAWISMVLLGVLSAALPAYAASRPGKISGTVRDSAGVPQMGAAIEVHSAGLTAALLTFTDAHGRYSVKELPVGRYQVKVSQTSFLPTLRENVSLRPGAEVIVNLTLNTLFEALQVLPMRGRTADDQDDWKWTLRSMASRPILRVLDDGPVVVVSSNSPEGDRHALKARVEFLAGSTSEAFGSGPTGATSFRLERSLFSSGTLSFGGHVGSGFDEPAVLRAAYSHQFSSGERPEVAITVRRFATQGIDNNRAPLQALAVTFTNQTRLADFAELQYGSEYQSIQFLGRAAALRPFGTLDLHLSPNTVVEYRYSTLTPNLRPEKGFDSAPADLSESGPRVSLIARAPYLESPHHQEVSISRRVGKSNFQLAGFADRLSHAALLGLGDNPADDASGAVLADPFSQNFTYNGGNFTAHGVRAVAQHKFAPALTGTLDVAYGDALTLRSPSLFVLGSTPPELAFSAARQASVAAKLSGHIPVSKTSWIASYKWHSGGHSLTPVDAYNVSAGEADPFFNLFIRQPLPSGSFLPGQMEALVDIRNLLAQGYIPVIGRDGHTLYLVQSARSIRGGVAFNF